MPSKFSDVGATAEEIFEDMQEEIAYMQRTARSYAARCRELEAQNQHLVKILSTIALCEAAEPVKLEDGRVMQFVDPDPARTLKLLQKAIKEARAACSTPSGEVTK